MLAARDPSDVAQRRRVAFHRSETLEVENEDERASIYEERGAAHDEDAADGHVPRFRTALEQRAACGGCAARIARRGSSCECVSEKYRLLVRVLACAAVSAVVAISAAAAAGAFAGLAEQHHQSVEPLMDICVNGTAIAGGNAQRTSCFNVSEAAWDTVDIRFLSFALPRTGTRGFTLEVYSTVILPDGTIVAAATDGTLYLLPAPETVCDTCDWVPLATVPAPPTPEYSALVFAAIATERVNNSAIRIWTQAALEAESSGVENLIIQSIDTAWTDAGLQLERHIFSAPALENITYGSMDILPTSAIAGRRFVMCNTELGSNVTCAESGLLVNAGQGATPSDSFPAPCSSSSLVVVNPRSNVARAFWYPNASTTYSSYCCAMEVLSHSRFVSLGADHASAFIPWMMTCGTADPGKLVTTSAAGDVSVIDYVDEVGFLAHGQQPIADAATSRLFVMAPDIVGFPILYCLHFPNSTTMQRCPAWASYYTRIWLPLDAEFLYDESFLLALSPLSSCSAATATPSCGLVFATACGNTRDNAQQFVVLTALHAYSGVEADRAVVRFTAVPSPTSALVTAPAVLHRAFGRWDAVALSLANGTLCMFNASNLSLYTCRTPPTAVLDPAWRTILRSDTLAVSRTGVIVTGLSSCLAAEDDAGGRIGRSRGPIATAAPPDMLVLAAVPAGVRRKVE